MTETFTILPSSPKTLGWVIFFVALLLTPFAITTALLPMQPLGLRIVFAAVLVAALLVAYAGFSSRHAIFEISPEGLRIRGALFRRFIPREEIALDEARIVDLEAEKGYRPALRTFGTGLPGYGEGWFRLVSQGKALLFLTRREEVVVLPTHVGYKILLSPQRPRAFLDAARRAWGAG